MAEDCRQYIEKETSGNFTIFQISDSHESISSLLNLELRLLRFQGMKLQSLRKSKLEILYLLYQACIVVILGAEACAILYNYEAPRSFDPETITKILNCSSYFQAMLSSLTFMYGVKKHLKSTLWKWDAYRASYSGIPDSAIRRYTRNFIIAFTVVFILSSMFIVFYYTVYQPVIMRFVIDRFLTSTDMDYAVWGIYSISGVFEFWIFCSFSVFIGLISDWSAWNSATSTGY